MNSENPYSPPKVDSDNRKPSSFILLIGMALQIFGLLIFSVIFLSISISKGIPKAHHLIFTGLSISLVSMVFGLLLFIIVNWKRPREIIPNTRSQIGMMVCIISASTLLFFGILAAGAVLHGGNMSDLRELCLYISVIAGGGFLLIMGSKNSEQNNAGPLVNFFNRNRSGIGLIFILTGIVLSALWIRL